MPEAEELAVRKETPWINNSWSFLNKIDVITQQFVFFSLTYIIGKLVINDVGIGLGNPCLMMSATNAGPVWCPQHKPAGTRWAA